MPNLLPARHVHLDFHTSELIPGVGERFSKKQFQQALKLGNLNHITLFAKCHHSWCYYPTKVGRRHPNLKIDLLGQQIEACREIGVRCPVYLTVGWSANDAESHPDWVVLDKAGKPFWMGPPADLKPETPRPTVSWKFMCIASDYRQHVLDLTRELCERYKIDGVFFDIMFHERSYSKAAVAKMRAEGIDLDDDAAVKRWHDGQWKSFAREARELIQSYNPKGTALFNGMANIDTPDELLVEHTHMELEDLPTVWGGYDKFQPRAKLVASNPATKGKWVMAMSGKFHTAWGEFGGFKHADAILYEAVNMVAWGAACCFGDQLHPSGEMDLSTYRNIGKAYRYVEQIEDYGLGGQPFANLGVWMTCRTRTDVPTPVAGVLGGPQKMDHDYGVTQMLLEQQIDFEIVAGHETLAKYDTVIVTGARTLLPADVKALEAWAAKGGNLIVIGDSALDGAGKGFAVDVGATYLGKGSFDCDYTVAGKEIGNDLVTSPFLNYTPALRSRVAKGTTVLAAIREPYFSRTVGHYCSHQNTPYHIENASHPAITEVKSGKGRTVWFAHPIGAVYYYHGARVHRQLFINTLRRVLRRPSLDVGGLPSAARVNVVHQPEHKRYCVHLTYGAPITRGRTSVIEDLPEFHDIPVTLRVPEKIRSVTLPVGKRRLKAKTAAGAVSVTVPRLHCHEVVVFAY